MLPARAALLCRELLIAVMAMVEVAEEEEEVVVVVAAWGGLLEVTVVADL
jgi:hypothetical protein